MSPNYRWTNLYPNEIGVTRSMSALLRHQAALIEAGER